MYKGHTAKPDWLSVRDLLGKNNGFQFVIPVYQRDYVWDADNQVKRLLDDYQNLLGNDSSHFLGIIIDYLENLGRGYAQQFFVVDGQQRLTTLFLLVYVIFEKAKKDNADDAIDTLEDCIFVSPKKGKNGGYKLEPLMNGQNIFTKIISGETNLLSEEEKNSKLYLAYDYIQDYVKNDLCDFSADDLTEALERLLVVDIPLDAEDNPQQIFESINGLGCELSSADLIRNFVLMQCPDGTKKKTYNDLWLPFENKFKEQREFADFFRYFISSQIASFVNKKFVYSQFRLWFLNYIKNNSVTNALQLLIQYADYYNELFYADLSQFSDNGLWKIINDYRNIKSKMPIPFSLDVMRLYKNHFITDIQLGEILETINSFIVRRAIIGMDTSGITRFFCTLLNNVKQFIGDDYTKIVDAVRYCVVNDNSEKGSRFPDDDEVSRKLDMQNTYDYSDALHYFFDKYENEKMQVNSHQSTLSLQIEHIMPQDGTKWYKFVGLSKEEYDIHKMRLGNLTLTTKHDNPKMSNNLFEYKSEILKDTAHFRLNVDVYSEPKWDKEEIDKRNSKLIKEFLRLYPLVKCSDVKFFEDKIKVIRKQNAKLIGRSNYASKIWEIVSEQIEEMGIFEQRENGTKAYYDFVFGRAYHFFIDLWNYKEGKINLGIWFSNYKNPNFKIFHENIDKLNSQEFNYYDNYGETKSTGFIKATLPLVDGNDVEEFIVKLVKEIYRINDIVDELYVEEVTNKNNDNILFYSELAKKELLIKLDSNNNPYISYVDSGEVLSDDLQSNYAIDFLENNGLEVNKNLSININTIIKYQTGETKTDDWVISCNPSYYNIIDAFKTLNKIEWKQNSNNIKVGSNVYIYVGYPYKEIKYKAIVTKINLTTRSIDDSKFYLSNDFSNNGKWMEIELEHCFESKKLDYDYLKDNGFGSPQGWSKVSKRLFKTLLKAEQ